MESKIDLGASPSSSMTDVIKTKSLNSPFPRERRGSKTSNRTKRGDDDQESVGGKPFRQRAHTSTAELRLPAVGNSDDGNSSPGTNRTNPKSKFAVFEKQRSNSKGEKDSPKRPRGSIMQNL